MDKNEYQLNYGFCTLPQFLAVLYLDDGSLSISKRINHNKKLVYLTPHIYLYLQNYQVDELQVLQLHIQKIFGFNFKLTKRPDGYGYVLKLNKIEENMKFLELVKNVASNCQDMNYKFDWKARFEQEKKKFEHLSNYTILTSDSNRNKNYSNEEVKTIIQMKKAGFSDQEIAKTLNRTYWSIVYKIKEIRKDGHL
ncbi:hypothetical protein [Neobacillus sp. D3-1R]|uniref:hypothetical protein n=1 Tax=Neobacillus sp. D3-1R TaxID=3445778 RepID=UPI003FA12C9F